MSDRTTETVVTFKGGKYQEPCVEVRKMRSADHFDRWCYKHHHWLNDAPPQKTAGDELLESVR